MQLFSMCGLVSGGLLSDRFGRKKTLLASNTILLTGWAIMYFANTFPQLLLGRYGFKNALSLTFKPTTGKATTSVTLHP